MGVGVRGAGSTKRLTENALCHMSKACAPLQPPERDTTVAPGHPDVLTCWKICVGLRDYPRDATVFLKATARSRRFATFENLVFIFGLIQKRTKKIKAVKKRPDACLRSTEISQTHWRSSMRNFGRFAPTGVRAAVSSRPEGSSLRPRKAFRKSDCVRQLISQSDRDLREPIQPSDEASLPGWIGLGIWIPGVKVGHLRCPRATKVPLFFREA